jgi:hypothetical protein
MRRPIEEYLKDADKLAKAVVDSVGSKMKVRIALSNEDNEVFERSCRYQTAKMVAEGYIAAGAMSEPVLANVAATRLVFAHAYKDYLEKKEFA